MLWCLFEGFWIHIPYINVVFDNLVPKLITNCILYNNANVSPLLHELQITFKCTYYQLHCSCAITVGHYNPKNCGLHELRIFIVWRYFQVLEIFEHAYQCWDNSEWWDENHLLQLQLPNESYWMEGNGSKRWGFMTLKKSHRAYLRRTNESNRR